MDFQPSLLSGVFKRRFKRFFAEIEYENELILAHVPNTGSLKGCLEPGARCLFSTSDDPKRKLKATLQMIKTPHSWVGVNTQSANTLVWEAFTNQQIPAWSHFTFGQKEVAINKETRIDFALWGPSESQGRRHFVEVKSVTMAKESRALFPDAVTTRGQKHLRELITLIQHGHTCEILFVVQRLDCNEFAPAQEIDPEYARLLKMAQEKGVLISAYPCELSEKRAKLIAQPLYLSFSAL